MPDEIDLSKVSDAELQNISNDVLRNLAIRVRDLEADAPTRIPTGGPHDKHLSVHTKNSIVEDEQTLEA